MEQLSAMLNGQQPQQKAGYTGVVDIQGEQVQIQNGVGNHDGVQFNIAEDGTAFVNRPIPIGKIENGKFIPAQAPAQGG